MSSVVDKEPVVTMETSAPSIATCLSLMDKHTMLANIREHSYIVARVAETILSQLELNCQKANLPPRCLIIAGALLHDIAKTSCLQDNCNHAEIGGEICEQLGYHAIAEIVREHIRLLHFEPERYEKGDFLAKEIIYYADKRVLHDQIVSLSERLKYILERYGNNDTVRKNLIKKNFKRCQDLEDWLCKITGQSAEKLLEDVSLEPYT